MRSLEHRIIARTFVAEETSYANREVANNKLKSERLKNDPELFEEVIRELAWLALTFEPDAITYVPNGARMFAVPVAEQLGLPLAHMIKEPDGPTAVGRMYIASPKSRDIILAANRLVVVEDISRTFSQTNRVLRMDGIDKVAVGEVSIVHRGTPEAHQDIAIPVRPLVTRYLPPQMNNPQLEFYNHWAAEIGS